MILMQDIQMNIQDESDKLQIEINEDKWKDAPVYVFGDDKN